MTKLGDPDPCFAGGEHVLFYAVNGDPFNCRLRLVRLLL
jgi:hypothetical protein